MFLDLFMKKLKNVFSETRGKMRFSCNSNNTGYRVECDTCLSRGGKGGMKAEQKSNSVVFRRKVREVNLVSICYQMIYLL